jgi:hypothetical protein
MAAPEDHMLEDRLQQYFDGELTGEAAEAVRKELEDSAEVRAKLEGLAHLRMLLARGAEDRGDEIDSEALFAGITAKLAAPASESDGDDADPMLGKDEALDEEEARPAAKPARPQLGVIPGGAPKSEAPPVTLQKKSNNVVWIATAAVLAMAAAVLLVVLQPFGGGEGNLPETPLAAAPPPGSEVVEVDYGYSTGAIFSVEGQEGERIAVVWISDDKPEVDDGESVERIQ